MIKKGIILAAGRGTRLYPATIVIGKPLLPIFDKPMVYYCLSTLMQAKIREICIVTNPHDAALFEELLGDGHQFGLSIEYRIQFVPKGIADVFHVAKDFIQNQACALVLGDNLFLGQEWEQRLASLQNHTCTGAHVFGFPVADPGRYGVMAFDADKKLINILEKPKNPPSNIAVTGLYFYDHMALEYVQCLKPSARGELEITDLNSMYLAQQSLNYTILDAPDDNWFDIGTHESMYQAIDAISLYIHGTGRQMGCIEEMAYLNDWISIQELEALAYKLRSTSYGQYLEKKFLSKLST